jgi:hypothetical protein
MPRSPWRRIRLVSIAAGLMAQSIRLDRSRHRQLGTSHGCRDHTVLPYASAPYVLRAVSAHRMDLPCGHSSRRRHRVHRIPPRVRDDRDTPLLSRRDSGEIATDLGAMRSGKFLQGRLDDPNQIEVVQKIRFYAHCFSSAIARAGERTPSEYVARRPARKRCPRHDDMIDWAVKRWPAEIAVC